MGFWGGGRGDFGEKSSLQRRQLHLETRCGVMRANIKIEGLRKGDIMITEPTVFVLGAVRFGIYMDLSVNARRGGLALRILRDTSSPHRRRLLRPHAHP